MIIVCPSHTKREKMKIRLLLAVLGCYSGLNAQNYDESKVPEYRLPDPLLTNAHAVISNSRNWEQVRRPEILHLFEENIYGQMPASFDKFSFKATNENKLAMDGKATLKEVDIQVFRKQQQVTIHLVLFVPNKVPKPAPVFLLINNRPKENTDPTRQKKSGFWPAEMVIDSGYAIAAFQVADLAPDDSLLYTNELLRLYPEQLDKPDGMKSIGAWAFGASRVMDYFEKEPLINARKVALVGHSRGGKTSLWAAAQDKRFAMSFNNCSGNSGNALARRKFGERVQFINTQFPHWFCNNYRLYNNNEDALPIDQHMLVALIAPRPVYATNASKDLWADPKGTFLALKNAEKVYALYKQPTALPATMPPINEAIIASSIGYHNKEGVHDMTPVDWNNFIRFANYHFRRKQ